MGGEFTWSEVYLGSFRKIKAVIVEDTLVSLPKYDEEFILHTDAGNTKTGGIVSQEVNTLALFLRKFNLAQNKYPTSE